MSGHRAELEWNALDDGWSAVRIVAVFCAAFEQGAAVSEGWHGARIAQMISDESQGVRSMILGRTLS